MVRVRARVRAWVRAWVRVRIRVGVRVRVRVRAAQVLWGALAAMRSHAMPARSSSASRTPSRAKPAACTWLG